MLKTKNFLRNCFSLVPSKQKMPPPKDLPGFYFDQEKNRYFPTKGPIPGVKRHSSSSISCGYLDKNKKHGINKEKRRNRMKPLEPLQFRELLGTSIVSNKRRGSFKQEYEKSQASRPQPFTNQLLTCLEVVNWDADQALDHCLLHIGATQSYEGHVNSHSHLQLGVNPSETLVLSGGEDQYVRIWSIKTSELIFEENVSNSILATVCWPQGAHGFLRPAR